MGVGRLDDQDYPAVTMGQAAELLGVQPAFLRSLDTAGVLAPRAPAAGTAATPAANSSSPPACGNCSTRG